MVIQFLELKGTLAVTEAKLSFHWEDGAARLWLLWGRAKEELGAVLGTLTLTAKALYVIPADLKSKTKSLAMYISKGDTAAVKWKYI